MKRIIGCLVITVVLSAFNNLYAKKENEKVVTKHVALVDKVSREPGSPEPKATPEPGRSKIPLNPNLAKPADPVIPADDSASSDPNSPFYKPHIKRNINLKDIYVGLGTGIITNNAGKDMPFNEGFSINGNYGVTMIDKYLILEINNCMDFRFNPNKDWFSTAFTLPVSKLKGINLGFDDEFTIGLQVVIAGSKKVTFTAGPIAGGRMTIMPSMVYGRSLYYVATPMSASYGLKTNLLIGNKICWFAQYSNTLTTSLQSYASQTSIEFAQQSHQIPVNFGLLRVGVNYVFGTWW